MAVDADAFDCLFMLFPIPDLVLLLKNQMQVYDYFSIFVLHVVSKSNHSRSPREALPDVAAHFHIQQDFIENMWAAVAGLRAPLSSLRLRARRNQARRQLQLPRRALPVTRAGLPLRGSGPDNVWQAK